MSPKAALRALDLTPGQRVLDIGCGLAWIEREGAKYRDGGVLRFPGVACVVSARR